jgi:membrane protein
MISHLAFAERLRRAVWEPDLRALPAWRALPLQLLRILHAVVRDLAAGQLTLRAMSLVYTTLLSLVPLIAVSFSVLKGLGVHYRVEPLLLNLLAPLGEQGVEITSRLIGFVENIRADVLGTVGLAFLIFTVVSLIQKIEAAFNATWRVTTNRSLRERFSNYLSVLLVGPLLVVSALGLTATIAGSEHVTGVAALLGPLLEVMGRLLPYLMVIVAFTLVYLLVPNTHVRVGSALLGALVAGFLWESAGWAFTSFVAGSGNYTAIYSAFATMILFMIWLFLSWLILLTGASFAFYHQHPEYLAHGPGTPSLSNRQRERGALAALLLIMRRFQQGEPPCTTQWLATRLALPELLVHALLEPLEQAGLLSRTADEPPALLPARDPDAIRLSEVLRLVRDARGTRRAEGAHDAELAPVDRLMADLEDALGRQLGDATLADLCTAPEAQPGAMDATRLAG